MGQYDGQLIGSCAVSLLMGVCLGYFVASKRSPRSSCSGTATAGAAGAGAGSGDQVCHDEAPPRDEQARVDEPCKMVLVVRMDLKMGKGKIAAQVGDVPPVPEREDGVRSCAF